MNTYELANDVENREGLVNFIEYLVTDLKTNGWDNNILHTYLEGMVGFVESLDGYYLHKIEPMPENIDWNLFARILNASTTGNNGTTHRTQIPDQPRNTDNVKSRTDLSEFAELLANDMTTDKWDSNALKNYLEGMAGFVKDLSAHYSHRGEPMPQHIDWKVFAIILSAATVYE